MIKIRNIVAAALSVLMAYLVANLVMINRWAWIFLKGNYPAYRTLFLSTMALAFILFGAFARRARFVSFAIFGVCAGYFSGLVAFFLLPFSHRSWAQIFSFKDISVDFFWSPVITLSWLIGFLASLIAWLCIRNMVDYSSETSIRRP